MEKTTGDFKRGSRTEDQRISPNRERRQKGVRAKALQRKKLCVGKEQGRATKKRKKKTG